MRRFLLTVLLSTAVGAATLPARQAAAPAQAPPPPPTIKVGDRMPDFKLPYLEAAAEGRVNRKEMTLSEYRGKKNVVLAFFPAAFSPG